MSDSNETIICIGSNTPDRLNNIARALDCLHDLCVVVSACEPYEAPDDSGLGQSYVNIVLECEPLVSYDVMRTRLKAVEQKFGRNESSKSTGVMPLDIDIIIWRGDVVDDYQYSREYFRRGLRMMLDSKI